MYFTTTHGNVHDPYVDISAFMHCTDRVVSYGFPRPATPGNTVLIMQYHGTKRRAEVVVNDATGDIATIYTVNAENDWAECATWHP